MARKRAGSIDSDDSTNARAERRAKRTQFLGTRLRGRTDSCDTHRRTTQAIIFFFIWAEKSLRRARKQRRSESAEEPVDVERGERSPQ